MKYIRVYLWWLRGGFIIAFAMGGDMSFWWRVRFAISNANENYRMQRHLI